MKKLVLFLFIVSSFYLSANTSEYKYRVKVYYPITVKWAKRNYNPIKLMINGFSAEDAYEEKYYSNTKKEHFYSSLNNLILDLDEIFENSPEEITKTYSKIRQGRKILKSYRKIKITLVRNGVNTPFQVFCTDNFVESCKDKILSFLVH
jgi:hypothetical protein